MVHGDHLFLKEVMRERNLIKYEFGCVVTRRWV